MILLLLSSHFFRQSWFSGENSSVPVLGQAGHLFLAQPTTSLLSTAVRTGSPPPRAPGSPDLYRASSVVSHTEAGQPGQAQRAGTPASVYAQGRVLSLPTTRPSSPQGSQADEQVCYRKHPWECTGIRTACLHQLGFKSLPFLILRMG